MRKQKISNAITNIQEKYILEATVQKKRIIHNIWFRIGSVAACLLLVIGVILWKKQADMPTPNINNEIAVNENGVTIPKFQISISQSSEADMIGFFIYQGRIYVQDEWLSNTDNLVGEYLGTASNTINEWTSQNDYVELSGSVSGDFYAVKGYEPSFMLCMKHEDGTIATYVNNNGITLKYGYELFRDKLHIAENLSEIEYQTRHDWYYGTEVIQKLEYELSTIEPFLNALNSAEFMRLDDIPLAENATSVYDEKEIYHLFMKMENGMVVHLRLFEGGYVNFDGIDGICVKMNSEDFEQFIELLK